MHSFLRSIGFGSIKSQTEIDTLVRNSLLNADSLRESQADNDTKYIEYRRYYAENVGVIVRGERDEKGTFHFSHMFPFMDPQKISCKGQEVFINKKVDSDAYTGMVDDSRMGVSLIFYIQNVVDYFDNRHLVKASNYFPVKMAALAREGKIILPTQQRVMSKVGSKMDADNNMKAKLVEEARKGDPKAIDALAVNDIDKYAVITERIKHEDLFSIVDTSFIPFGSESDVYSILCNIVSSKQLYNTESGERIWQMECICNGVPLGICINDNDLLGVPIPGMRFRGTIWMQGKIEFKEDAATDIPDDIPFS